MQRRIALSVAGLTVAAGVVTACNSSRLLDVSTPNAVPVDILDQPVNAALAVASAVSDFQCALGTAVVVEGLISGEMNDAQLGAAQWDYARRTANTLTNGIYGTARCDNSAQVIGIYYPLATARYDADHAIANLTKWTDAQVQNRATLLAVANLYAGFSYATLGMSMCQAAFDNGPAVNQKGMFALAEARFSAAIAAAPAGADSIKNAAYLGRARVRLYQGNTAGALQDAQLVPAGFVMNSSNDASNYRNYNRVYAVTKQFGDYSIPSWSQNMTTENAEVDPRSATTATTTRSADNNKTQIFVANKYAGGDAVPIPIARYEEAQLIIAEIQGGAQAAAIINTMRASVGLQPYTGSTTDASAIKNLVISERQRVLFLEGQRNYDVERFQIAFNPPVGTAFPFKGGTYGNTTCLPLPDIEKNNNPSLGPTFVPSVTGS